MYKYGLGKMKVMVGLKAALSSIVGRWKKREPAPVEVRMVPVVGPVIIEEAPYMYPPVRPSRRVRAKLAKEKWLAAKLEASCRK